MSALIPMSAQERAILSQYLDLRHQYRAAPEEQKPKVEELIKQYVSTDPNLQVLSKFNITVYIADRGGLYHLENCGYLSRTRNTHPMPRLEAMVLDYPKCTACIHDLEYSWWTVFKGILPIIVGISLTTIFILLLVNSSTVYPLVDVIIILTVTVSLGIASFIYVKVKTRELDHLSPLPPNPTTTPLIPSTSWLYCVNCGFQNLSTAIFCKQCGKGIE